MRWRELQHPAACLHMPRICSIPALDASTSAAEANRWIQSMLSLLSDVVTVETADKVASESGHMRC